MDLRRLDHGGGVPVLAMFTLFVILSALTSMVHFQTSDQRGVSSIQLQTAADQARAVASRVEQELNHALATAITSAMYEVGVVGGRPELVESLALARLNRRIAQGWSYPNLEVEVPFASENEIYFSWLPDGSVRAVGYLGARVQHLLGPEAHGIRIEVSVAPRFKRLENLAKRLAARAAGVLDLEELEENLNLEYQAEGLRVELGELGENVWAVVQDVFAAPVAVVGRRLELIPYSSFTKSLLGVLEGLVFDSETGEGIPGAELSGEIHSKPLEVKITTDERGYFSIRLPRGEHAYFLNAGARGYDPKSLEGRVGQGERKFVRVPLKYNPFDLALVENSGELKRGWVKSVRYLGSSSTGWEFERWGSLVSGKLSSQPLRRLPPRDPSLKAYLQNPGFRVENLYRVENYTYEVDVYGWVLRSNHKRRVSRSEYERFNTGEWRARETKTVKDKWTKLEPVYTTYYVYRWVRYDRMYVYRWYYYQYSGTEEFTNYRGRVFYSGSVKYVFQRSYSKQVDSGQRTYPYWRGERFKEGGDPYTLYTFERFYQRQTGTRRVYFVRTRVYEWRWLRRETRQGTRRVLEGHEVFARVERKTITHRYSTSYRPKPWGELGTEVVVKPRNGYEGEVRLELEVPRGVEARLGSRVLRFSSSARTSLALKPLENALEGAHLVKIKAYDERGRLVEARAYELRLSSLPKPRADRWSRSTTVYRATPDLGRATLVVLTEPVQGEVFVDGQSWGVAPQTREVAPGSYLVGFGEVEGYRTPEPQLVELEEGETRTVVGVYELKPKPPDRPSFEFYIEVGPLPEFWNTVPLKIVTSSIRGFDEPLVFWFTVEADDELAVPNYKDFFSVYLPDIYGKTPIPQGFEERVSIGTPPQSIRGSLVVSFDLPISMKNDYITKLYVAPESDLKQSKLGKTIVFSVNRARIPVAKITWF